MIDIHSHLLPSIDDGPRELAASLDLARAYVDDGVKHVVVTPHIYPGIYDNTKATIGRALDEMRSALLSAGIPLALSQGAEVRVSEQVMQWAVSGELPFIGQQNKVSHVLLEMPDGQIPLGMHQLAEWLLARQIIPVIAHPERNRAVMAQTDRLMPLVKLGCKLQVTAGSLLGDFGRQSLSTANALLARGWVHAVASDAHGLRHRAPRMRAAWQQLMLNHGQALADELTRHGPARLCGLPA